MNHPFKHLASQYELTCRHHFVQNICGKGHNEVLIVYHCGCRYGQYLFEQGKYSEAMEHFGASSLDLPTILSLFPTIKLPKVGILKKDMANLKENESDGTSSKESTPSMENLEGKLSCHIPYPVMSTTKVIALCNHYICIPCP